MFTQQKFNALKNNEDVDVSNSVLILQENRDSTTNSYDNNKVFINEHQYNLFQVNEND